jgi:hypothetical protein
MRGEYSRVEKGRGGERRGDERINRQYSQLSDKESHAKQSIQNIDAVRSMGISALTFGFFS